jgi:hypothetical protein
MEFMQPEQVKIIDAFLKEYLHLRGPAKAE